MDGRSYTPSLAQARSFVGKAKFVPMYREILADLETPVSAYLKYAAGRDSFLLESVEGIEHVGRYSFIGARPREVLDIREGGSATLETPDGSRELRYDDPLELIDSLLGRHSMAKLPGLPRFIGGAVGFLTYEIARCFEKLPVPPNDPHQLPLGRLLFVDSLLVFDHSRRTIKALTRLPLDGDLDANYREAAERIELMIERLNGPVPAERLESIPTQNEGIGLHDRVQSNVTPSEFMAMVRKAKEYIKAGDIIQVVPSQRLSLKTTADPFSIYRALRVVNPSPYMFFLDYGDYHIVGASPEMLTLVENGVIHNRPLAGTRWRGATPEEDDRLARELLADEKEPAQKGAAQFLKARVRAANGDWSALTEAEFLSIQTWQDVLVTEGMYHPPDTETFRSDDLEFIELKNVGPVERDLGGLTFTNGIRFTFPRGTRLPAGAFAVLAANAAAFTNAHPGIPLAGQNQRGGKAKARTRAGARKSA